MRIGIDARFLGPGSKGLGRYTQKLLEYLQGISDDNTYVIFLRRDNYDLFVTDDYRFEKVIADYKWYSIAEQTIFVWLLMRQKCELMHFPHFNVPLLYWRPYIVTIHDLILLNYPTHDNSTRSRWVYWFKYQAYKLVIAHAVYKSRKIAAVSTFTSNDILQRYKISPEKIALTLEAGSEVDRSVSNSILVEPSVRSIINTEQKYFLYVGNAYPHKNLTTLVQSFAAFLQSEDRLQSEYRDMILVLVGRKDAFYERLENFTQTLASKMDMPELPSQIIILDTVNNASLGALYKGAHAFTFVSLYEGFGLPPLEACTYGIPVLSSRLSSMPEILGDAVLYCDVESVQSVAHGMSKIVHDKELRSQLMKMGPVQSKKFSWRRMVEETHKLYR